MILGNRAIANLEMLKFAAEKLGTLNKKLIFLGGSTTGLFITDTGIPDIRPTLDVDCIVDVITLQHYHQLEAQLRQRGFKKSINDDVICRWHYDHLILDVMPTNENILGFGNRWYKAAIKETITHKLNKSLNIRSISATYFLATKLEAFYLRGNKDFFMSHDFEDIITVIDGRPELFEEIRQSESTLRNYLAKNFATLIENDSFHAALPGHINYGGLTRDRTQVVLKRIENIADLAI